MAESPAEADPVALVRWAKSGVADREAALLALDEARGAARAMDFDRALSFLKEAERSLRLAVTAAGQVHQVWEAIGPAVGAEVLRVLSGRGGEGG